MIHPAYLMDWLRWKEEQDKIACGDCEHWKYCRGENHDPMVFCYEPEKDGDGDG